jgi:hypothetical protein
LIRGAITKKLSGHESKPNAVLKIIVAGREVCRA